MEWGGGEHKHRVNTIGNDKNKEKLYLHMHDCEKPRTEDEGAGEECRQVNGHPS